MASKKKPIELLFKKGPEELPEDKDLRNNIVNALIKKHGSSMNDHSEKYTSLLKEYIKNSKKSSKQKRKFKNVFFYVAIGMLVLSFLLFVALCGFLFYRVDNIKMTSLTGFISSLVGLLSLYIIIPKIIAKYLFDREEDNNMTKIVESIQTYDEKIFANMHIINREIDPNEESNEKTVLQGLKQDASENKEESKKKSSESDA